MANFYSDHQYTVSADVCLIGYYGYGNAGDDCLLNQSLTLLNNHFSESRFRVLYNPRRLRKDYHKLRHFGPNTVYLVHRFHPMDVFQAIFTSRYIVFGGGNIFQDGTSRRSLRYYLSLLQLACFFKKTVIMLGHGIGPITDPRLEKKAIRLFRRVPLWLVRESLTSQWLAEKQVPASRIHTVPDLAFYKAHTPESTAGLKERVIGVSVRELTADEQRHMVRFLSPYSKSLILINAERQDNDALLTQLELHGSAVWDLRQGLIKHRDPSPLPDVVLSARYHTCVWAALRGIPFVALGNNPKLSQLAAELGQEHLAEITFEGLQHHHDTIINAYSASCRALTARVEEWIRDAQRYDSLLSEFFKEQSRLALFSVSNLSYSRIIRSIRAWTQEAGFHYVVTLNPQIVMACLTQPLLAEYVRKADLCVADGVGITLAQRWLNGHRLHRITGADLTYRLLNEEELSIYLIGSTEAAVAAAAAVISKRYPVTLAGHHHGFFTGDVPGELMEDLIAKKPDIILVGMGVGRQDEVIMALSKRLTHGVAMGVGGVIDLIGGLKKRAPEPMRKLGMEWIYRGLTDPKRLTTWAFLPKFTIWLFKQRFLRRGFKEA